MNQSQNTYDELQAEVDAFGGWHQVEYALKYAQMSPLQKLYFWFVRGRPRMSTLRAMAFTFRKVACGHYHLQIGLLFTTKEFEAACRAISSLSPIGQEGEEIPSEGGATS